MQSAVDLKKKIEHSFILRIEVVRKTEWMMLKVFYVFFMVLMITANILAEWECAAWLQPVSDYNILEMFVLMINFFSLN